jgi:hypothetical protein
MRLCFLGISQNLASYSRRFCRRLAQHHKDLLEGPEMLDKSITDAAVYAATRTKGLSPLRKREIEKFLRSSSAYETATEVRHSVLLAHGLLLGALELIRCAYQAIAFYKSVRGGCAFALGDLLPSETSVLFNDLQSIFKGELGSRGKSETPTYVPTIDDLIYTPVWKPRFGSSCSVPGIPLLSDACGRVPR